MKLIIIIKNTIFKLQISKQNGFAYNPILALKWVLID